MDFRTDLALERQTMIEKCRGVEKYVRGNTDCSVTEIRVTDEEGAKAMDKPIGRYITADIPPFSSDGELTDGRLDALSEELKNLIPKEGTVLIAGLGNKSITADALGPASAEQIFVTRHIGKELSRALGMEDMRSVAAISPGVLGKTGIEAAEIVKGVCKGIKPSCVIAIDALAARDIKRLGTTVQISDTGISPGSGVGNHRRELSEKTLGIPVISIGVPTVINAYTVALNVIEATAPGTQIPYISEYSEYVVASREADLITQRGARLISLAVNCALQPQMTTEDLLALT